jgi:rubrerythrin
MPEFANPFAGLAADRKVTHDELIRAIRYMVAAEYEAVQLYMQLAESTDNQLAQAVLRDIADEEIVHAGEFLKLLKELAPGEAGLYAKGEEEVIELMETLGAVKPEGNPIPAATEAPAEAAPESGEEVPTAGSPPSAIGNLYGKE